MNLYQLSQFFKDPDMNTTAQANANTPATTKREFNTDRTHTVGQYLNYDQDAKRVVKPRGKGADRGVLAVASRIDTDTANALRALRDSLRFEYLAA